MFTGKYKPMYTFIIIVNCCYLKIAYYLFSEIAISFSHYTFHLTR